LSPPAPDVTAALEALEATFESRTSKESPLQLDQATQKFIRKWLLIRYGMQDAPDDEKEKLFAWGEGLMKGWDIDEPALAHSQKIINRLAGAATGEASKYAGKLGELRRSETSTRQRANATGERHDPLKEILRGFISRKSDVSQEEVIGKLSKLAGGGVIVEVTDDDIYYVSDPISGKEKSFKLSSLGPKLSGLRNKSK